MRKVKEFSFMLMDPIITELSRRTKQIVRKDNLLQKISNTLAVLRIISLRGMGNRRG
jgi:hypothetical protein